MDSDRLLGLNLVMVAILIALTAFFVAVEFAIVRVRESRVDQMILEGNKKALGVKQIITHLDDYLSACQLGITITALGLGWLGEPTVERILHPLFHSLQIPEAISKVLSFIIAFVVVTYLHVVVGELAPKTIAIRKAETVAMLTAKPLIWFNKVMRPFIWTLNGSANQLVKLVGIKPASEHEEAHSEEELQIIINESFESGKINQNEYGYVNRIFAFDNLLAKEIMVPRTDMVCLYTEKSRRENLDIIKEQQYTRFPVVRGNKDNIIGFINTKQFFLASEGNPDLDIASILQPSMAVSEVTPVNELLQRMQREGTHMAILIDEYGGTAGLVTIEDILEEIVGEIRDEFDKEEEQPLVMVNENHVIVDGKVTINHINDLFMADISTEDVDTIGGWLFGTNPEMKVGETLEHEELTFKLLEKEPNRFRKLEIIKLVPEQSGV
ncbi:hemolysin family protein [Paenibacillus motobuensis]|uniref:hemolysin family protein n=1 Tax=Paenibacillus TaxID=44249 RepID=UPI002040DD5D|nr:MULTISPECIES: hemolysin family protein [Paenibacillus]MCM3042768.1 hemolysin family protein [Paenibacillus lutimineralis]MCM3649872.1 hemolysin family protein [Paenibacillus motobuensis]